MRIPFVETPVDFIESYELNTKEKLDEAKKFLYIWDKRDGKYYKNLSKINLEFDMSEREHYRNTIKYWEKKNES